MKSIKSVAAFVLVFAMIFSCTSSAFALSKWQYKAPDDNKSVGVIVVLEEKDFSRLAKSSGKNESQLAQAQLNNVYRQLDAAGISVEINYEYTAALVGFSGMAAYDDIENIEKMKGVAGVYPVKTYTIPKLEMDGSNEMTGAEYVRETLGLSGSGILVAVIDSGFYVSHAALQVYDGMLSQKAMTKENAEAFITSLGHGHYVSDKIPFAYNYSASNEDVTDTIGHGSHVSGIIAGYVPEDNGQGLTPFCGIAPDAQILAMKVCPDNSESVDEAAVLKALDDAYKLGADVVNLSLGAPNGFSYNPSKVTDLLGDAYAKLGAKGVAVCCSAGNESNNALGSSNFAALYGNGFVTADYTDYGILGEPASYTGNIAVASVNNAVTAGKALEVLTEGGVCIERIAYLTTNMSPLATDVYGTDAALEFVHCGKALSNDDIEGKELAGKIAFVQRGVTSFAEKWDIVSSAGAIGLLVYDNADGILSASGSKEFPFYMLTKVNGEKLLKYFDNETSEASVRFRFTDDLCAIRPEDGNTLGGKMSDFSSWGPVPDLGLKPNISGVGGNVYSIGMGGENDYASLSGTSMSSPDIAGAMAVLISFLRSIHPEADVSTDAGRTYIRNLAEVLMESSAKLVYQDPDNLVPASARQQGAGLLNLKKAIETASEGGIFLDTPLSSLGDSRTGEFYWTISIAGIESAENISLEPVVLMDVLTDAVFADYVRSAENYEQTGELVIIPALHTYNTITQKVLSETAYEFVSTIGAVTDGKALAECSLKLNPAVLCDMENHLSAAGMSFNGAYLEGFVKLMQTGAEDEICHNTFLGYAGDWTKAPVLEQYSHVDVYNRAGIAKSFTDEWNTSMTALGNTSACITFEEAFVTELNMNFNFFISYDKEKKEGTYLGIDPYSESIFAENGVYSYISDNLLGFSNVSASGLLAGFYQLRNAKNFCVLYTDKDTGELYSFYYGEYESKSPSYGAGVWGYGSIFFDGTDMNENKLPSGTRINVSVYANIDYGEDELGEYIDLYGISGLADNDALKEKYLELSFDCYVDADAPELTAEYVPSEGGIVYEASDNIMLTSVRVEAESEELKTDPVFGISAAGIFTGLQDGVYKVIARDASNNECIVSVAAVTEPETPEEPETPQEPHYDPQPYYPPYTPPAPIKPKDPAEELNEEPTPMPFTDISEKDWFYDDVKYVWENNLFNGISETLFDPNTKMTREMLATVLYRMAGSPKVSGMIPFEDIGLNEYYSEAVVWAYQNGIAGGYGNGLFGTGDNISREDASVMLMRFAKLVGKNTEKGADLARYTDSSQIASYALDAMSWANGEGIINGNSESTLFPKGLASRAEIAAMIHRLCLTMM